MNEKGNKKRRNRRKDDERGRLTEGHILVGQSKAEQTDA